MTIRGHVTGADPSKVRLSVDVTGGGQAGYPPAVALEPGGRFGFWVSLLTPGEQYTIRVLAVDDQGNSHSDALTVTYVGWAVEVQAVDVPASVAGGQPYDVAVTVRYSVPEPWTLRIGVQPDDAAQASWQDKQVTRGAGSATFKFRFSAPLEFQAAAPNVRQQTGPGGISSIEVSVTAGLPGRNNQATASATIPLQLGLKGAIRLDIELPFPGPNDRLSDYGNLKLHEWTAQKGARRTTPQLIYDKGIGFTFAFANTGQPGRDPALTFHCPAPPGIEGWRSLDWRPDLETIRVEPGQTRVVRLTNQLQEWGNPVTRVGLPPRVAPYWVRLDCLASDGNTDADAKVRDWFRVGNPRFEMQVHTIYQRAHQPSWPAPRLLEQSARPAAASETVLLSPESPIDGRWLRIAGGQAQSSPPSGASLAAATSRIFFPYLSKPIGPVRIVLDWIDSGIDVDLHVYDPMGRSLGGVYGHGIVRNGIPGAGYGGPDSKPEWVTLHDPAPGDYLLVAYAPGASGPVVAFLSVEGYLGAASGLVTATPTVTLAPTIPGPVTATSTATNTTVVTPPATATASATNTPLPPGTAAATASPSPTVSPSRTPTTPATATLPAPTECRDGLTNGDFEQGLAGWQFDGEVKLRFGDLGGGRYAAMILGRNSVRASVSQTVNIPADAEAAFLTYWWRVVSDEPATATKAYDTLSALSPLSPDLFETFETLSNLVTREQWLPSGYDVSNAAGPSTITFEGETNPRDPTEFYLDHIRLALCTGGAPRVPQVTISPAAGPPATSLTAAGSGFEPGELVTAWIVDPTRLRWDLATSPATAQGEWVWSFLAPGNGSAGDYDFGAVGHSELLPVVTTFAVSASGQGESARR